jgi:hypothetical protein
MKVCGQAFCIRDVWAPIFVGFEVPSGGIQVHIPGQGAAKQGARDQVAPTVRLEIEFFLLRKLGGAQQSPVLVEQSIKPGVIEVGQPDVNLIFT